MALDMDLVRRVYELDQLSDEELKKGALKACDELLAHLTVLSYRDQTLGGVFPFIANVVSIAKFLLKRAGESPEGPKS